MTNAVILTKTDENKEIIYISPEAIIPNRSQPRAYFDADGISELAESIEKYGILQPLTVRELPQNPKYAHFKYELIAGERRLRAAKLLNLAKVPCILMESDSKTSAELAIIENLHRRDLNVFEEALAIASLIEIYNLTQEQVADRLSMTQAGVANKLRLLRLSEEEKQLILENKLTERHARALIRIKNQAKRREILERVIKNNLNVQQTEDIVEQLITQNNADETPKATPYTPLLLTKCRKSLISTIESAISKHRANGATIKTKQTETDTEIIFTVAISKI